MSTKQLGDLGEDLACEYLVKNGYKIIGKNYRISFGEIDIVARKKFKLFGKRDRAVHFVEVKTLDSSGGRLTSARNFYPEEHVDWKKQNKYKRLVEIWLLKNKFPQNYPCQVDVIAITMMGDEPKIDFFENVVSG